MSTERKSVWEIWDPARALSSAFHLIDICRKSILRNLPAYLHYSSRTRSKANALFALFNAANNRKPAPE